jgi:hypothetical protein
MKPTYGDACYTDTHTHTCAHTLTHTVFGDALSDGSRANSLTVTSGVIQEKLIHSVLHSS